MTRQDRLFLMVYRALQLWLSLYPKERAKLVRLTQPRRRSNRSNKIKL